MVVVILVLNNTKKNESIENICSFSGYYDKHVQKSHLAVNLSLTETKL